jgi:hypothetical protein
VELLIEPSCNPGLQILQVLIPDACICMLHISFIAFQHPLVLWNFCHNFQDILELQLLNKGHDPKMVANDMVKAKSNASGQHLLARPLSLPDRPSTYLFLKDLDITCVMYV